MPSPQDKLAAQPLPQPPQQPQAPGAVQPSVGPRPHDPQQLKLAAGIMAKKQGLDPELVNRVFSAESGWNPEAVSPKGAIGIGQLMPQTAARLGLDPRDPIANMHGSMLELKRLMAKYQNDPVKALGAYNAGEQAIDSGKMPAETAQYIIGILSGYRDPSASPVPGADSTIGPREPGLWERAKNLITPYDPTHGREQLSPGPQAMMTGPEQQRHPILTGAGEFLGGLTTPGNMLMMAGGGALKGFLKPAAVPIAERLLSAGFTAEMLKGLYEQYPELKQAMDSGDAAETQRIGTQMGLGAVFAALSGSHALRGEEQPQTDTSIEDARTQRRLEDSQARQSRKPGSAGGTGAPTVSGARQVSTTAGETGAGAGARGTGQGAVPVMGGEPRVAPMSAESKPPAQPVQPPLRQDLPRGIGAGLGARPASTVGKTAPAEGPQIRGAKPVTAAGQTGAREITGGTSRNTPMAPENTRMGSAVGRTTGTQPVRQEPKPLYTSTPEIHREPITPESLSKQTPLKPEPPFKAPSQDDLYKAINTKRPGDPIRNEDWAKELLEKSKDDPVARKLITRLMGPEQRVVEERVPGERREGAAEPASSKPTEPIVGGAKPEDKVPTAEEIAAVRARYASREATPTAKPPEPIKLPTKPQEPTFEKGKPRALPNFENAAKGLEIPANAIPRAVEAGKAAYEKARALGLKHDAALADAGKAMLKIKKEGGFLRLSTQQTALQRLMSRYNKAAGSRMHEVFREKTGQFRKDVAEVEERMRGAVKTFDKERSPELGYAFIDAIQNGEEDRQSRGKQLSPALERQLQAGKIKLAQDPSLQATALELKGLFQQSKTGIQAVGKGALNHFLENYFPQHWEEQPGAKQIARSVSGKRPLEGPKTSLRERSIPTHLEGIDRGLHPVHSNPIDQAMNTLHEQNRYIMAHNMMKDAKQYGIAKFVRAGERPPEGWKAIEDKMYNVKQWSPVEKGFVERGKYYMPQDAAKVINHYLSSGLRGNKAYDIVRRATNLMNQVQLGISAYHFGTTSVNAVVSQLAQGLEQLAPGKGWTGPRAFEGIQKIMSSPLAPVKYFRDGVRVSREYLDPGSAKAYEKTAKAVAMAGGSVKMDPSYKNSSLEKFIRSWNQGDVKGVLSKSLGAAVEAQAKPIMEWLVPAVKLGAFHDMASDVFGRATRENWSYEKTRSEVQKQWDSVDNRFGEVVYDNLAWNKVGKDLAHIAVRSVGWNFGTFRELGGGLKDLGKYAASKANEGLSSRAAYTLALPVITGIVGAIYMKAHTGQMPQQLKDYYFPKTGEKTPQGLDERVSLPSYMKDVFSVSSHPLQTALNKGNPLIEGTWQMLNNRDFYGKPIRHIDDPWMKNMLANEEFVRHQMTPFSLQNIQTRQKKTVESSLESIFGMTPASKEIERSGEQNLDIERRLEGRAEGGKQLRPRRTRQTF